MRNRTVGRPPSRTLTASGRQPPELGSGLQARLHHPGMTGSPGVTSEDLSDPSLLRAGAHGGRYRSRTTPSGPVARPLSTA